MGVDYTIHASRNGDASDDFVGTRGQPSCFDNGAFHVAIDLEINVNCSAQSSDGSDCVYPGLTEALSGLVDGLPKLPSILVYKYGAFPVMSHFYGPVLSRLILFDPRLPPSVEEIETRVIKNLHFLKSIREMMIVYDPAEADSTYIVDCILSLLVMQGCTR